MQLLTLKDAAREINVPYQSVLRHYNAGRIPTYNIGRVKAIDPLVLRSVLTALGYQPRREQAEKERGL